eukprot:866024-Prorocentrum_minimum.AAC.1
MYSYIHTSTSSQVGKAALREAKARWELMSVVFCERMVPTKESNTVRRLTVFSRKVPLASSCGYISVPPALHKCSASVTQVRHQANRTTRCCPLATWQWRAPLVVGGCGTRSPGRRLVGVGDPRPRGPWDPAVPGTSLEPC